MKQHQPPKLARRLFEWYCGQANVHDLLGDLDELFLLNVKSKSAFAAKWIYWKQVLSLIFSYAIKKRKKHARISEFASSSISFSILNNYFKVASRNLYKHKYFSIVNIVGLAIGMSVSLLFIAFYVHVCTFDDFHANKLGIYRILTSHHDSEREWELASAPFSIADNLDAGFVGVKKTVRITSGFSGEVVSGNLDIPVRGFYTEPSFFDVFSFPLVKGNSGSALVRPNTIVLSESTAKKLYHTTDVLGKAFEMKNVSKWEDSIAVYEITGVMADPPANSHMSFEILASHASLPDDQQTFNGNYKYWHGYGHQYVYVLLSDQSVSDRLSTYLKDFSKEASKKAEAKVDFHLQPLTEITPGKDLTALTGGLGPQWDKTGLTVFGIICLFILLPACFNYTNISIARALKRSKEIGLRKTMGGLNTQIFLQFITETVVITSIALVGGLLIFYFIRGEFQSMMVSGSMLDLSFTWPMAIAFTLFALFTGFVAGFFPALHFAGLNPIQALRNQLTKQSAKGRIRKGLIVFQFALSFCFIIALVVFGRQYRYSLNYDFGFHHENILDVKLQDVKPDQFRSEFSKLSSVQKMSMSSGVMGTSSWIESAISVDSNDSLDVYQTFADEHYIDVLKLNLIAGRNFPEEKWQREKYIIINEEFIKQFKLGSAFEALGKVFRVDNNDLEVIGVLKDFNYTKLNRPIEAFMIRMNPEKFAIANLSVSFTDVYSSLAQMESAWKIIEPEKKFEARFFDDEIREAYDEYEILLKLVGFLGLLAISISLLGLLGMVVYTSETKTKEVGIRKVMGASTRSITLLLSKDYFLLMMWAALFAIPVSVLVADFTLPNMQHYHITLNFWDILLSLVILLALGLATIASQTFKTASTNPADTLRAE